MCVCAREREREFDRMCENLKNFINLNPHKIGLPLLTVSAPIQLINQTAFFFLSASLKLYN